MFSLFKPRCPLNSSEKTWIEYRVSWLVDRLGLERVCQIGPILPTGEFFPLPYEGRTEQVQSVLRQICRCMQVESGYYRVNVFGPRGISEPLPSVHQENVWEIWPDHIIYEGAPAADSNGASRGITFHLAERLVNDLETVIAVFGREISRSLLLEHPIFPRTIEFEHTVELMPLFFGMGIFSANAVLRQTSLTAMGVHSWTMIPQGSLPARYIGYALALLCWLRNEPLPRWRSYLRKDAENTLRASLKYLEKTGDTILDREPSAKCYENRPLQVWLDDLRHSTPSRRVAALWAVQSHSQLIADGNQISLIAENLSHHDPFVRSAAAQVLDTLGEYAQRAVPALLATLEDRNGSVRMVAALALGKMPGQAEEIIPDLLPLLNDRNINVANAAAWSLGQFGLQAEEAGPAIARLLRRGILHCEESTLEDILDALLAVTNHPEEVIMETLLERDAETCSRALDLLKERQIDAKAGERTAESGEPD